MKREISENSGAFCPSCERFIGPADVCPYCDADSAKPPILRVLRWMALALAVGGLAFLYAAATAIETPAVTIAHITPMMNFAQAQITGTVRKDAYMGKKNGTVDYVSFILSDGSGELKIVAYDGVAREMNEKALIPREGDSVQVNGILDASADDKPKLRIISAENVEIRRQPASHLDTESKSNKSANSFAGPRKSEIKDQKEDTVAKPGMLDIK